MVRLPNHSTISGEHRKPVPGASWIAEYGDPDNPEDWEFLKEISAYHTAVPGGNYPPILIATSRRDDRVHPGHARKMAAKLWAIGCQAYFYEPAAGGHGYGKDNRERAVIHRARLQFPAPRDRLASDRYAASRVRHVSMKHSRKTKPSRLVTRAHDTVNKQVRLITSRLAGDAANGRPSHGDRAGRFQPSQAQIASPMTSSLSRPLSHGSSSVNMVTHCR